MSFSSRIEKVCAVTTGCAFAKHQPDSESYLYFLPNVLPKGQNNKQQ
jgi:hypothetical protein